MNGFKTLVEAENAWNNAPEWEWSRHEFDSPIYNKPSACIILEEDEYWIITHPTCVKWRARKEQVVKYLN